MPYFFSDQYDVGMEYAGHSVPGDEVVFRGDPATREFIAFWLRDGRVTAGMNVNVWDVNDDIQALVRAPPPSTSIACATPTCPWTTCSARMSIACAPGLTDEDLGDRVRGALSAEQAEWVEEVAVAGRTPAGELPSCARERIGIADDQENLLVRVVLRHPTRSLAKAEANALRDRIYAALHEGSEWEWAPSPS